MAVWCTQHSESGTDLDVETPVLRDDQHRLIKRAWNEAKLVMVQAQIGGGSIRGFLL